MIKNSFIVLLSFTLSLCLIECKPNGESEAKKNYKDSLNHFYDGFLKDSMVLKETTETLNLLGESPLQVVKEGQETYRLLIIPSFANPSVFRVYKTPNDTTLHLIYKRLNGLGGYNKGIMDIEVKKAMSRKEHPYLIDSMQNKLEKLGFWKLKNDVHCDGADGTVYVLEGIKNNSYQVIYRWSPELCRFDKTKEFLDLVEFYLQLKEVKSGSINNYF